MKLSINNLKIFSLLVFIGFAVVIFVIDKPFVPRAAAYVTGPPPGHTGAPGEISCTNCHSGGAGTGQFSITAPASYTPGQTYQIVVRHQTGDSTRRRWGFELTAWANNTGAGSLANLNATTQTTSLNARNYILHTQTGTFPNQAGSANWTFNWTAPATNVGAVTLYAAGNQANNDGTADGDQIYTTNITIQPASQPPTAHHVVSDFDGDAKADVSVFRPSSGVWFINRSTAGFFAQNWGTATDKIAPADYDGDDKTDLAVWRENGANAAAFYIFNSSDSSFRSLVFGNTGDTVTVGDWDGDGKADPAVYRPGAGGGQSTFYYLGSVTGSLGAISWGASGDLSARGDFDGDGKADAAVYRPSNQIWYIRNSSNGELFAVQWGLPTDKRAIADFDGDNKTDIAVFRDGNWFIRNSSNGVFQAVNWGIASDVPVPADYDGDNKADIAVYRDGNWYIRQSSNGNLNAQSFGLSSDSAVPASYLQ